MSPSLPARICIASKSIRYKAFKCNNYKIGGTVWASPTRGSKHAGLLPGACLALLLSGIWTGDAALLSLANPPGGILSIRLASLAAYLAAFGAVVLLEKRHAPAEAAPGRSAAQIAWLPNRALRCARRGFSPCCPRRGLAGSALVFASLALAKLVGPVLSIPLLTLFATLPARHCGARRRPGDGRSLPLRDSRPKRHGSDNMGSGPAAGGKLRLPCRMRGSHVNDPTAPAGKDAPSASRDRVPCTGPCPRMGPHPRRTLKGQPTKSPLAGKIVFGFVGDSPDAGVLRAGEPSCALPETAAALAVMAAAALATWKLPSLDTRENPPGGNRLHDRRAFAGAPFVRPLARSRLPACRSGDHAA